MAEDIKPISSQGESLWGQVGKVAIDPVEGLFGKKDGKAVFDKLASTITGKNAYEVDKANVDFKMLSAGGIANPDALGSLKRGTRQDHIKGDYVLQVDGDQYDLIKGNDTLEVTGYQSDHVHGKAKFLYDEDRKVVVGGDYILRVYKASDTFVFGESKEQFVGVHEVTAPEEFEWKQLERGFSALKLDMSGFAMDIHLAQGDLHVIDAEAKVFETKGGTFHEILEAQRGRAIALIICAALELDIMFRGDVLVDLGTGTPFR